jgi:hypothetical protein
MSLKLNSEILFPAKDDSKVAAIDPKSASL